MTLLENIIEPWALERDLKNENDVDRKIDAVSQSIFKLLDELKAGSGRQKIDRLVQNPFDKELTYDSLFALYENIHVLANKIVQKVGAAGSLEDVRLGSRTAADVLEDAVNQMIFRHERDELLAPVSAKLAGKKGDYGPAMYSEVVKRAGRNLISGINSQINELLPTVTKICQGFTGIANQFVSRENRSGRERQKYEEVWLIYQAEKAARERIAEIASITKDKVEFFQDLLDDFAKIRTAYDEKTASLVYLRDETIGSLEELQDQAEETTDKRDLEKQLKGLDQKLEKLEKGDSRLQQMERQLSTLKNLIVKFPAIQNQIETFIDSDLQAKSVFKFLEEINQEMKGIFGQQNIQAFEVIAALVYKLKATSLMYDDANYYQAVVRMVDDVTAFLQRTLGEKQEKNIPQKVSAALQESGLQAGATKIHQTMIQVKALNNRIHQALMTYGNRITDRGASDQKAQSVVDEREELTRVLEDYLAQVQKLSSDDVFAQYRACQRKFQSFTEQNLEEKHIGEQVLRAFLDLGGRGEPLPMKKEELVNFQKFKLYTKMMPNGDVQRFFSENLKAFMRGEPCEEITPGNIRLRFASDIARAEEKRKQNPAAGEVPKHEMAVRFVAENLTPKEVESLARFVPCMPRNELRLTFPPGKVFIDIAEKHVEFLQRQSQRQFVLINSGEERKSENEITFKELSGRELIKKAYATLLQQFQSVFDRIDQEKQREEDFIAREQRKWRRELDLVIQTLQARIEALKSDSPLEPGKLKRYSRDETALLSKHIGADQFDKIESLFGRIPELDRGTPLADVVLFLVAVLQGFYQLMERDELVKIAYETAQEEKRRLHLGGKTENIEQVLKTAGSLSQQKKIDDLLTRWEFGLNRILPAAQQELKDDVPSSEYADRDLVDMARCAMPDQLQRSRENLSKMQGCTDPKQLPDLLERARPLLNIVRVVFEILEKDEAMVLSAEAGCRERLSSFSGDQGFKADVDVVLSQVPTKPAPRKGIKPPVSDSAIVENVDKLLKAARITTVGADLPADLPVITRGNLKRYVQQIRETQISELAELIRGKDAAVAVNPVEKRLLIAAYQYLKENPGLIAKEDRRDIIQRYKILQAGKR